ncbi:ABC transporter ATP-binding protein [Nocardia sp. alder85J]|uniref:ABC transporter ATP-binding protein n=1 Tax=Nocardia sp. alder85J TaxID=2862949 RepID=UPI001CD3E297|nr:ABC transporter ATP-binding protein [Nocardia sp. alder85J]MCX4093820.1 ABC transporter ATP-binding protein [Nocardia sp. alder85J]
MPHITPGDGVPDAGAAAGSGLDSAVAEQISSGTRDASAFGGDAPAGGAQAGAGVVATAAPVSVRLAGAGAESGDSVVAVSGEELWRGVAAEEAEATEAVNLALAARSRRLLWSLLRPYRARVVLALVIIVLDNAAMVAGPLFVAHGLDAGVAGATRGDWTALLVAVGGATGCALLSGMTTFVFVRTAARLSQQVLFDLRMRVFLHVQRLPVVFHETYTSGKIVARLTSDLESLEDLLDRALNDALGAVLSLATIAVVLLWMDVPLALVVLVGFVPLVYITRWAQRNQRAGYRRTRGAIAKVVVHFVETMGGIRAVQAFRREQRNEDILDLEDDEYRAANSSALRGMAAYIGLVRTISAATTVVILLVGGWRVIHGHTAIGVLAAFLLYLRQFYGPLDELAQVFNSYQSAAAALERISGILEEQSTVADPIAPRAVAAPGGRARGELRFDAVSFDYPFRGGAEPAADPDDDDPDRSGHGGERRTQLELSLSVAAGQVVALVGATGAGKSTLAKLVARFYDPTAGSVRLDGVDLRDITDADLRRNIAMVTQESYLFSGSVADNIRLGKPAATDDEVRGAADAVGLADFVDSLPDGFETDVRKRGGRLSAGQRQLVAFARVFLADPAVIVLDEATSSLDIPGERLVQQALETVLHGRTAVIIAHRLSTVAIADRVLVLDSGRLVEDGSPDELIAATGRFAALHTAWRDSLV